MSLGIDLGTSSVKVVLLSSDGSIIGSQTCAYTVSRPHAAWAEIDPGDWWAAIDAAVRALAGQYGLDGVRGIGLSGQMHGLVLVDGAGQAVRPAVLWLDARAAAEVAVLVDLPADRRARLANPPSPGMAGPVLSWLIKHEPDAVARATAAIQPKDWIRARLTAGQIACEASDASATLMFDVLTQHWDPAVVDALGIPRRLLPDILADSATRVASLDDDIAAAWGLQGGVAVAAGAGDTAAAALGSGLYRPGTVQLTIGTGVQIVSITTAPTRRSLREAGDPVTHLYRSALPGGWYSMAAGLTGGTTASWVCSLFGVSWEEFYALAERPPQADDPIFLPYLSGERTPYLDSSLRGSWTDLRAHHDRDALLYCALEGLAFAVAAGLDALPGLPSGDRVLRIAGGGTVHPAWRRMLATVLDATLYAADVSSASARGAGLLGLTAAGILDHTSLIETARLPAEVVATPDHGTRRLIGARRRRYLDTLALLRQLPPHQQDEPGHDD